MVIILLMSNLALMSLSWAGSPEPSTRDTSTRKGSEPKEILVGSAQGSDGIYELSAEVMSNIVHESNGDPEKMQFLLEQAQKDPAAFAGKWTPSQKAKLEAIARRSPASQGVPVEKLH